jgi:RHS repeat-associated protein
VAINYTGFITRSEFSYDGLNRIVKIVEKTGSTINSTRKFVWCGQEKLEFRDATDAVTQRNYTQGQYVGTTAYFYTRDHLGSIREMFTGGGTVVARYDYDPYGRSTTVLGTTPTDFNFTGLYRHAKSNIDLAVYRTYDPDLGRWLNRDPIAENGGLNLYAYVSNDSARRKDPLGFYVPLPVGVPVVAAGAAGLYVGGLIYNAAPDFWAQSLWGWLYPDQNPSAAPPKQNRSRCEQQENCPLEDEHNLGPLGGYRCEYWCRKSGTRKVIFVPWEEGGCPKYIPHP